MIVFLNGEFVPEERAVVSVFDRSFRYGDGLFETMLAVNGKIFRWGQHWERLATSAKFFKISLPQTSDALHAAALELLRQNEMSEAVVRLQLSRGIGERGYAPTGCEQPFVVMTAHPAPPRPATPWKLVTCPWRMTPGDIFQGHKTASRAWQVMAAAHARESGADETVMLDIAGNVTCGGTSNVFAVLGTKVITPKASGPVRGGVTRAVVMELCAKLGVDYAEADLPASMLSSCDGVFVTLTSRGVVEVQSLDGVELKRSLLTNQLQSAFEAQLLAECA